MILLFIFLNLMPGERLEYAAKYSVLHLGTMTLEIRDTIVDGKDLPCYYLISIVNSSRGLRWLFSLNDTIEVLSTVDELLPMISIESTHEGKYNRHVELRFDHDIDSVVYDDSVSVALAEDARDLVSFWYYLRTIPLDIGDTIPINIHKSMENYRINCLIVGHEDIETPLGRFNTILVNPQTAGKGVFGSSGGMSIWYSNDRNRYPVQILAKMKIGTVLFQLTGVHH